MSEVMTPYAADANADLSVEALGGTYRWTFCSQLNSNEGPQKADIIITVEDATSGKIKLDIDGQYTLTASYDETTAKLTIPTGQELGFAEEEQVAIYNYHAVFDTDGRKFSFIDAPIVTTFDGNQLIFPTVPGEGSYEGYELAVDLIGIGNISKGWYYLASENKIFKPEETLGNMPPGTWKNIGRGTFYDGWHLIALVENDYTDPYFGWEVTVEQNELVPTIYRLNCPYNEPGFLLADTSDSGYIVFDAADPEYIMVYHDIYAGYTDCDGAYSNFNLEGLYTLRLGIDKKTVTDLSASDDDTSDILTSGKLDGVSRYENGTIYFENCRFSTEEKPDKVLFWSNPQGKPYKAPSILEFTLPTTSGIDGIEAEVDNTVQYFNLQGMPVVEPAEGIYIRRTGNKAVKVVVR